MVKLRTSPVRIVLFILIALAVTATIHFFAPKVPDSSPDNPAQVSNEQADKSAKEQIDKLDLKAKISSLLVLHTPGTDPQKIAGFVEKYQPAGLILMQNNIPKSFDKLRDITTAIHSKSTTPALIAIDEEGCSVKRLKDDIYPCAGELKNQPPQASYEAFQRRSHLLKQAGINLNFGIVADITDDENSFIYPRTFGDDPKGAGELVAAAVSGTKGVTYSTLKHFPGHGATGTDTHQAIPNINTSKKTWLGTHAVPFRQGIEAGADIVMFGHLAYTKIDPQPATLSKIWHDTLNEDLGFNGITITDDMIMLLSSGNQDYSDPVKNAVQAINAGNTLLLYVTNHESEASNIDIQALIDGLADAVKNNQLSEETIKQSATRVIKFRQALSQN
jgi:beta-N-acetylhexosaminidase